MSLRVDWRTTARKSFRDRPMGLAAEPGNCPHCGNGVLQNQPLYLVGVSLIERDEGEPKTHARKLDLSSSEWVCDRCVRSAV